MGPDIIDAEFTVVCGPKKRLFPAWLTGPKAKRAAVHGVITGFLMLMAVLRHLKPQ